MIKIGSGTKNGIVINDASVSREHALIKYLGSGEYRIEDLNSKNGTYVNDRRIIKSRFLAKDTVTLGTYLLTGDDLIYQVKKILNRERKDFSEEFGIIIKQLQEYESKKDKILKRPILPHLLKAGILLAIILLMLFYPGLVPNDSVKIALVMSVGLVSVVEGVFSNSKLKKQKKLDFLKLEYEDLLQCPKCNSKLIKLTSAYLAGKGKCPNDNCDAYFKI